MTTSKFKQELLRITSLIQPLLRASQQKLAVKNCVIEDKDEELVISQAHRSEMNLVQQK